MTCPRCGREPAEPSAPAWRALRSSVGWCSDCERAYDAWVRRHAADIIWSVMGGGLVVLMLGVGLPLLGLDVLVGASAAFAGFGTIYGVQQLGQRRRRRQFLAGIALPRAYLTEKSS